VNDLGWSPKVGMEESLRRIFESYRTRVREAQSLTDSLR
jgi:hypothetical protein